MKKELAKHVISVSYQAFSTLQQLIPLLKEHCSDEEYKYYLKSIASIGADLNEKLEKPLYDKHPELFHEIEEGIKKYGKLI